MKKTPAVKPTDAEQVALHMDSIDHPLKAEMEALRKIIKSTDKRIAERIKWNAPSYYYGEDIVTFGPQRPGKIMLVFHHPEIVKIKSDLLEGDYKDRRLASFKSSAEVTAGKKELQRVITELLTRMEK